MRQFSLCVYIQLRKTRKFYIALVRGHVVDEKIDISVAIGDALHVPAYNLDHKHWLQEMTLPPSGQRSECAPLHRAPA